jgi:hypothetical protein
MNLKLDWPQRREEGSETRPGLHHRSWQAGPCLLSIEDHQRLVGAQAKITELLAMPEAASIAFDPPKITINSRPADLT